MESEQVLAEVYLLIKDELTEYDDFVKIYELIEQMSKINPNKAFDMWYPLLKQYENFVIKFEQGITSHLTMCCMDALGAALGYTELDKRIIGDDYLYDLLFKRYCLAGDGGDYTEGMIIRKMVGREMDIANTMFLDIFNNGNREVSWYEVMDSFIYHTSTEYEMNQEIVDIITKWGAKIEKKKDKAKFLSSIMSVGYRINMELFQQFQDDKKSDEIKNFDTTDLTAPLITLVKQYSHAINDRQMLKGLLSDFYPDNKLYVNILLMAYDDGLVSEIRSSDNIEYFMKKRMSSRLSNNYGISEKLADSVIEAWTGALK